MSTHDRNTSDLPASLGKPATRALHGAGITTLAHVAMRTEAQLLALHGMGPKGIKTLKAALAAQGKSLRG